MAGTFVVLRVGVEKMRLDVYMRIRSQKIFQSLLKNESFINKVLFSDLKS